MDKVKELAAQARAQNIPFYVLCSAGKDKANTYKEKWNMTGLDWLVVDLVVNKTAMRSNPGLMLLKQGVVQGKWSFRDYPEDLPLPTSNPVSR